MTSQPQKKKVSRPKSIKLGPFKISLWFTKEKMKEARKEHKDVNSMGMTDMSKLNIFVDSGFAPEVEVETLLHEILHAIWYTVGLSESPAKEHEEHVVCSLSPTLLFVLRENPELVRYLLDKN